MKTISDRIFELLKEKGMSQKEFSTRTGIAESSISDWKKKRTKILIICEVLEVTPYDLLSRAEHTGNRSRANDTYVISKGTDIGVLVESYQQLSTEQQKRLMGYLDAIKG